MRLVDNAALDADIPRLDRQRQRLALVPWSEIQTLPKNEPLIEGLLDAGTFSIVFGASGAGKTFFVLDLAAHIPLGWEWREHTVKKGSTVYIAAEGGSGFAQRLTAFRHHHEIETEGVEFYVIAEPIDLCQSDADTKTLTERIAALAEPPALIVVDTLSRSLAGGNENASDDMGAFVQHCDELRASTGAHIMVVHHTGKDDSRGARGHSLLKAAADTEIEVKDCGNVKTATFTKQRDLASEGESFAFKLEGIELDERQACVLVPADDTPVTAKGGPKLTANQNTMYEVLVSAGRPLSSEEWNERAKEAGLSLSRKATAWDLRNALKTKGLVYEGMNGWSYNK
jgi:RecA-family ATPase